MLQPGEPETTVFHIFNYCLCIKEDFPISHVKGQDLFCLHFGGHHITTAQSTLFSDPYIAHSSQEFFFNCFKKDLLGLSNLNPGLNWSDWLYLPLQSVCIVSRGLLRSVCLVCLPWALQLTSGASVPPCGRSAMMEKSLSKKRSSQR